MNQDKMKQLAHELRPENKGRTITISMSLPILAADMIDEMAIKEKVSRSMFLRKLLLRGAEVES